jgi:transposase
MKKSGPDRKYTDEYRDTAVKQVIEGGRSLRQVARSLEMSPGTLANWVAKERKGEPQSKRPVGKPMNELEAEVSRLRQEVARLRIEKEILKKAAVYFAKESM